MIIFIINQKELEAEMANRNNDVEKTNRAKKRIEKVKEIKEISDDLLIAGTTKAF